MSRQPTMFTHVLFPEPLGPIIATNSPLFISRFSPRTAGTSTFPIWYTFHTFSSLMIVLFFFIIS